MKSSSSAVSNCNLQKQTKNQNKSQLVVMTGTNIMDQATQLTYHSSLTLSVLSPWVKVLRYLLSDVMSFVKEYHFLM